MEAYSFFKSLLALIFVLGLIGGVGYLIRKFGEKSFGLKFNSNRNIVLEEITPIDHTRRIAVVKYKNKKYVLLLGSKDTVIDVIGSNKSK